MKNNLIYKYRYIIGSVVGIGILGVIIYFGKKALKKTGITTMETINKVWDSISEKNIEKLHPKVRDKAREFVNKVEKDLGIKVRVTSTLRTYEEQNALYAKGRTTAGGIVTNAKGGQSNHNFGTALDIVPIVDGKADWKTTADTWSKIAKVGKEIGFSWGGDWKSFTDKPHFEMTFGNSLAQLRQKYESGQRDGEYVKLV